MYGAGGRESGDDAERGELPVMRGRKAKWDANE